MIGHRVSCWRGCGWTGRAWTKRGAKIAADRHDAICPRRYA